MGKEKLEKFYQELKRLEKGTVQRWNFGEAIENLKTSQWPQKGVYFFFDDTEAGLGDFPRIVRVGTVDIDEKPKKAKLRGRLKAHYGAKKNNGGNHRESSFRKHVGNAFINSENLMNEYPEWDKGNKRPKKLAEKELPLEQKVSKYIRNLGVVVLDIPDRDARKYIESNAIGFLSALLPKFDSIDGDYLLKKSIKDEIKNSQLWNVDDVDYKYTDDFLDKLKHWVDYSIAEYKKA
ncbi:hypothetical protein [Treponema primitia]|uniref:hypothetical protein n=1 Tax=Treponema primitia TaxID=88058 RepID=UPI000255540E|nr:hypothetical protein [Treponema primitia]